MFHRLPIFSHPPKQAHRRGPLRIASAERRVKPLARAPTLRYGPAGDSAPQLRLKAAGMAERLPFGPSHGPKFPFSLVNSASLQIGPELVQGAKRRSEPLTARTDLESCDARGKGGKVPGEARQTSTGRYASPAYGLAVLVVRGHALLYQSSRSADLSAGSCHVQDGPATSCSCVPVCAGDVGPHVRKHGILEDAPPGGVHDPRLDCAMASPWSAARRYQRTASASSLRTPAPLAYMTRD